MLVETYEEQETKDQDPVEAEEHRQLSEKMGLAKQVAMHRESGHVDHYRKLTAEELFVFMTNFPNIVRIDNYDGVIPLRVLQVVAHFKETHPGMGIKLLCPQPGEKDPVVIGSRYDWQVDGDTLLLARFGSALDDFSVLRDRAFAELERRMKSLGGMSWDKLNKIRLATEG